MEENYDPSDSEDEYSSTEKELLNKFRKKQDATDSEEDVFAFSESDPDSDKNNDFEIADSDVEGQENSDDDLPDRKAWGKNKKSYYATDYVDKDYGGFGDDEQAALMEEEEAKSIQKRLIEQLGEEDFSIDFFNKSALFNENRETIIKSDLSQMSKREKIQLFEKESPEFMGLVEDFKSKLTIAKDCLHPVLKLVDDGILPKCPASKFVRTNYELILNYCTNISFYLLLKSQRINIHNHPLVKRLYQYRQMLNKIEPIYLKVIKPQLDNILHCTNQNIHLKIKKMDVQITGKKHKFEQVSQESTPKKLKLIKELENDEDTGLSNDESDGLNSETEELSKNKSMRQELHSEESGLSDNGPLDHEETQIEAAKSQALVTDEVGDKREITYQIAKNKGLTPYRKKEQRNPRVKHKMKYRKAKIRRKGAIREPRKETSRYSGEASGIKANLKKSIKIK